MYCNELTLPFLLSENSFQNNHFLQYWENLKPELLNQKISRMLLSVNKKTSRLAVLGELERYPLLISALSNVVKYEQVLIKKSSDNSIISQIFKDMQLLDRADKDCWLTRVRKIKAGLGVKLPTVCNIKSVKPMLDKQL